MRDMIVRNLLYLSTQQDDKCGLMVEYLQIAKNVRSQILLVFASHFEGFAAPAPGEKFVHAEALSGAVKRLYFFALPLLL